jgi:hypothetical protein
MIYEPAIEESVSDSPANCRAAQSLPAGLILLEQATAALRRQLRELRLDDYVIFHAHNFDFDDFDRFLPGLDPRAKWQPLPLLSDAQQPFTLSIETPYHLEPAGIIHLPRHHFILARWHLVSLDYCERLTLMLAAAPSAEAYGQIHQALIELRRKGDQPVWQIFRSVARQETKPRQPLEWSDLLLPRDILQRVRAELINFFTTAVADLYRTLGVPYRRGRQAGAGGGRAKGR